MLITGARTSTLLTRLPFLPAADAYVAENGGRIFYPDTTLPTAMPLAEDSKWRKTHNATGVCLLDQAQAAQGQSGYWNPQTVQWRTPLRPPQAMPTLLW